MGCSALLRSAHFPPGALSFYELKEGRVHALVRLVIYVVRIVVVDIRLNVLKVILFIQKSNRRIVRPSSCDLPFDHYACTHMLWSVDFIPGLNFIFFLLGFGNVWI